MNLSRSYDSDILFLVSCLVNTMSRQELPLLVCHCLASYSFQAWKGLRLAKKCPQERPVMTDRWDLFSGAFRVDLTFSNFYILLHSQNGSSFIPTWFVHIYSVYCKFEWRGILCKKYNRHRAMNYRFWTACVLVILFSNSHTFFCWLSSEMNIACMRLPSQAVHLGRDNSVICLRTTISG